MPLSTYHVIWSCPESSDHVVLYSTRTGSLVRVSEPLLEAARCNSLTREEETALADLGLWVADREGERREMASLVDRTNAERSRFRAIVVLNLDCNLACPYCYEETFRGKHYMSDETADRFIEMVARDHLSAGRDICLDLYGGEPLLSIPLIRRVAGSLFTLTQRAGVKFSCFLFTNGTLLTRPLVEELVPLGLTGALITLDGPPEIHNRQRPFVSGKGSFDLIVDNIRSVRDLMEIQIGGNYTAENYRRFPEMLDHIIAAGIEPASIGPVQFSPITEKSSSSRQHDGLARCQPASDASIREAVPYLLAETARRGFTAPKPTMGACMVEFTHDLVINHDGSLFKCPAFMGWPELSVGTLKDGIRDYADSHNLLCWQNDECLSCPYLPLCFGGCRLNPLLKTGSISGVDCRKDFFDATLQKIVTSRH
jgi:uncharacterized protein